jgi:hypothetical protein
MKVPNVINLMCVVQTDMVYELIRTSTEYVLSLKLDIFSVPHDFFICIKCLFLLFTKYVAAKMNEGANLTMHKKENIHDKYSE